ncbi:MAG: hypothetical protein ACKO96_12790, partial [Flammeovirgaceae bacterium]
PKPQNPHIVSFNFALIQKFEKFALSEFLVKRCQLFLCLMLTCLLKNEIKVEFFLFSHLIEVWGLQDLISFFDAQNGVVDARVHYTGERRRLVDTKVYHIVD